MSSAAKARVVASAGRIADADGLEAVTLARVAADLGMRPPSLYNHVEGRAGLMRALRLEAVGELAAAMTDAAVGRSREEALRAVAVAYRAYALEHPGRYATTLGAPTAEDPEATAAAEAAIRPIVAILAGWGVEGDEALHLVRVIRSALHGFVSIELGGGFGLPLDLDTSFALLVDSLVAAIIAAAPR
jgi:AcrR family transcriptional regulator